MTDLFRFSMDPWELILRGTVMYLALVLVLRFILRRDVGSLGVADVLFIVLVADASQNAMAGDYRSIADGGVLVATLVAWNVLLDWLAYRYPAFRRLIEPPAVPLIRNGRWMRRNLRREWITADEISAKLREQGIDDIAKVKFLSLEPDGELGVIRLDDGDPPAPSKRKPK